MIIIKVDLHNKPTCKLSNTTNLLANPDHSCANYQNFSKNYFMMRFKFTVTIGPGPDEALGGPCQIFKGALSLLIFSSRFPSLFLRFFISYNNTLFRSELEIKYSFAEINCCCIVLHTAQWRFYIGARGG